MVASISASFISPGSIVLLTSGKRHSFVLARVLDLSEKLSPPLKSESPESEFSLLSSFSFGWLRI